MPSLIISGETFFCSFYHDAVRFGTITDFNWALNAAPAQDLIEVMHLPIERGEASCLKGKASLTVRLGFLLMILFIGLVSLPLANADWPMYHSDTSHSGVGAGNPTIGPTLIWRHGTGNQIWSSPAVTGDTVYIGSSDGYVYALNASTGSTVWTYATGGEVRSSPAVFAGIVYVGSMDNKVYALSASTGSLIWSYVTGNDTDSSPAVFGGVVYIGSLDGNVYALNASNGAVLWSYATGSNVVSSPAVVSGVVYVGSMDHNVYALNASTGAIVWSYTTGGGVYSPPAVVGGVVYVGSWDYSVYALNASSGVRLWSYATGNYANACPAVDGKTVYVGSRDGNVYALNASSGALVWNSTTGNTIGSSPAIVDGVIDTESTDGKICLRMPRVGQRSGAIRRAGESFRPLLSSPALSTLGRGMVDVYALGGSSVPGLLQQVWVPQPLNAVEAIGVTVVALAAVSVVLSFASNPLSALGEQAGEKGEGLVPDSVKEWLQDIVSSKQKTEVEKRSGPLLRPTKPEVLAYTTSIILLALAFSYVKVSSLDQIWDFASGLLRNEHPRRSRRRRLGDSVPATPRGVERAQDLALGRPVPAHHFRLQGPVLLSDTFRAPIHGGNGALGR